MPQNLIRSDRGIATKEPGRHFHVVIRNTRPTEQFLRASGGIDQTGKTISLVKNPSTVRASREHFRIILFRQKPNPALSHVLFIFKVDFGAQVLRKRTDITVRFVRWNLPPATTDGPRSQTAN